MQEASDAHSKTADSDTVSTYQVSSVQLVTDKKLEAFNTFSATLIAHKAIARGGAVFLFSSFLLSSQHTISK